MTASPTDIASHAAALPAILAAGGGGEMTFAIMLIALLGIGAQWIAWRVRMPSILLLLALGFAVGPGSAWLFGDEDRLLDPNAVFGDLLLPLVGVSVGLILYEGGLTLRFSEIRGVARSVVMLVTVGALVTWALAALAGGWVLGLPVSLAVLLGAVLIVTGPTVIGPLLTHIRPAGQVGPTLKWEGIVIDPIGALAAVLTLEVILIGSAPEATGSVALALVKTIVFGGGIGLLAAGAIVVLLERFLVPESLQNPVSLVFLICAYTLSNAAQAESGLLAATVMGIALANQTRIDTGHILEFKENLRVLIIGVLFIVLAARIDVDELLSVGLLPVLGFLGLMIVVVRPASVLLSTIGGNLTWRERLMICALAPRGIVAAAVSSVFALSLESAVAAGTIELESPGRLVSLTFLVIVGTVLFYGFFAPVAADLLRISDKDPQGVVIIGASKLARVMAGALSRRGARVLLVDTNRSNVTAARLEGLDA
ncbi:MAG: cation:proton antiporter, partial [Planctomycetota bacterium]